VNCQASSRGVRSGAASASSTTRWRIAAGMRFQWRRAAEGRGCSQHLTFDARLNRRSDLIGF
jgi:hypothetical protein